jgi:hypothetical protein
LRAPVTASTVRPSASPSFYDGRSVPSAARRRWAWLDWLNGTDPGLMRLQLAVQITVTIGVVIAAEWLFVRGTGALQAQVPANAPQAIAAQLWMLNHALLVIAIMFGAIIAMISGFGVSMFPTARTQLGAILFLPLPLLATLSVALVLHVRLLSLALLVVTLTVGTYCRRFGPLGFNGGVLAFMGSFLGFFIQDYVPIGDFGWLAAEVGIGVAGTLAVHFALFYPRAGAAVRRMQRSYAARARDVASEVADLYETTVRSGKNDDSHQRAERQLQRQLLRLNEAALLVDAQLSNPAAVPAGWSAATLHQRLFDAEVGLTNAARFALAIARRGLPAPVTSVVTDALAGVRTMDFAAVLDAAATIRELLEDHDEERAGLTPDDRIILHRFATSVTDFSLALRAFGQYPESDPADDAADEGFTTQVATFGGWLPGSAFIAGAASQERGGAGLLERVRLAPYARTAIQMGIAISGAIIAGDALSGRRFYWAVIAVFVTFMGANTAGEQIRKSAFRIAGTFVGVLVGSVLAHLIGDRVGWQIAVVLVSLFLGLYLFRINYAFMVIGITVMVSQLYVELDEFSNSLLVLRLEETAIGAGVAIATVLLVLPLHIGRVARVAARQHLVALADLIDRCLDRLADPASGTGSDLELRAASRRVDMAYQALVATVWPLRTPLFGSLADRIAAFLATAVAAKYYARNLLLDASTRCDGLEAKPAAELATARRQLAGSIAAITTALAADGTGGEPGGTGRRAGQYVRSASLFARVADVLPEQGRMSRPQLALRDLELLDGALAEAARWAGVPVTDLDTTGLPDRVSTSQHHRNTGSVPVSELNRQTAKALGRAQRTMPLSEGFRLLAQSTQDRLFEPFVVSVAPTTETTYTFSILVPVQR